MSVHVKSDSRRADTRDTGGVADAAFSDLVEAQRAGLHAHCYRMLGSVHDADDALQETLLRAWRSLPGFEGRSSLRTWVYRIATNVCLDAIARRPKRVLPVDYAPAAAGGSGEEERLPDSVWIEPYPDETIGVADGTAAPEARFEQREALELAFVAALQQLPAGQRAVLILRDVLGFSAKETAESLGTSLPSVNGALIRARKAVDERLPESSQQVTLRGLGDRRLRELVERFADAFERGDVDAILALLTEDATFAMPPYPSWRRGRAALAESWLIPEGPSRLRYVRTRANCQPALGAYSLAPGGRAYRPIALDVLGLRDDAIATVIAFRNPALFRRFGLPEELAGQGRER